MSDLARNLQDSLNRGGKPQVHRYGPINFGYENPFGGGDFNGWNSFQNFKVRTTVQPSRRPSYRRPNPKNLNIFNIQRTDDVTQPCIDEQGRF